MLETSVYLHIPFCIHRCGYCDFNTYAGQEALIPRYVEALCSEIHAAARGFARHAAAGAPPGAQPPAGRLAVGTIFFGGGTPSLLSAAQMAAILDALRAACEIHPTTEITLEANPGTLSPEHLAGLRQAGFNRISLGVQSANPVELRLLERTHDFPDVIRSVAWARQAGFDNLNLDLIFGLPEQALSSWQRTLERALALQPEHFSLYALTLEHGTPFGRLARRGLLAPPDPDAAAEMYEWAAETLARHGYVQYEISNWALHRHAPRLDGPGDRQTDPAAAGLSPTANPAYACRHNLQYWRSLPWLGLGAGAHGFANRRRTVNTLVPQAYIERLSGAAAEAD
ncbi:MAG: radical SAM family heme chaperone HemW, partial [Chloroflexota bacterium]